jgi:hypothetical protein
MFIEVHTLTPKENSQSEELPEGIELEIEEDEEENAVYETTLINVDFILMIKPYEEGSLVALKDLSSVLPPFIVVKEEHTTVIQKVRQASS